MLLDIQNKLKKTEYFSINKLELIHVAPMGLWRFRGKIIKTSIKKIQYLKIKILAKIKQILIDAFYK